MIRVLSKLLLSLLLQAQAYLTGWTFVHKRRKIVRWFWRRTFVEVLWCASSCWDVLASIAQWRHARRTACALAVHKQRNKPPIIFISSLICCSLTVKRYGSSEQVISGVSLVIWDHTSHLTNERAPPTPARQASTDYRRQMTRGSWSMVTEHLFAFHCAIWCILRCILSSFSPPATGPESVND